jgi:hypothetical protein
MHHARSSRNREEFSSRLAAANSIPPPGRRRALVYRMGASAAAELQPELQLPTPATHPPAISC